MQETLWQPAQRCVPLLSAGAFRTGIIPFRILLRQLQGDDESQRRGAGAPAHVLAQAQDGRSRSCLLG